MTELFDQPGEFFSALEKRLSTQLPGEQAQNRMTSRARISTEAYLEQNPAYRTSAVLLPLFPHLGTMYTALIRRPSYEGTHSGQLALPGGKAEKTDTSIVHTALRETQEEVGVKLDEKDVLGALTPVYIPVSNFLVHPFVGKFTSRPQWITDRHEVDSVLEFPLSLLMDPAAKERRRIPVGKNIFMDAPCYIVQGQVLWGATAMMFSELEELIKD